MKKTNSYLHLLAGTLGVISLLALAPKLAMGQSCCGAMAPATNAPAATAGGKVKPDLLTTCPVSGEKLGEIGRAFVFTNNLQEVKLCCPGCKKEFDKNPEKYLAKIRAADKK